MKFFEQVHRQKRNEHRIAQTHQNRCRGENDERHLPVGGILCL